MSEVAQMTFSCGSCKKQYRWKPELAGKKVKCKCGHVMTAPAEPPTKEPDLDALYDLAEDAKAPPPAPKKAAAPAAQQPDSGFRCPSCGAGMTPGAVLCTSCGFNLKTKTKVAMGGGGGGGKKGGVRAAAAGLAPSGTAKSGVPSPMAGYAPAKRGLEQVASVDNSAVRDLYIPLGLLVVGLILQLMHAMYFGRTLVGFPMVIPYIGIGLIVDMFLISIGCVVAIKMIDVTFGEPLPAALKVAAIAIAPSALGEIVSYIFKDTTGATGWAISAICYYTLFHFLFDFDLGEVLLLSCIIAVIRMWIGPLLSMLVVGALLAGAVGGGGRGSVRSNEDRQVEEAIADDKVGEAKQWFAKSGARIFYHLTNADSVNFVDDCYAAGAKKVWVFYTGEGIVSDCAVELPRDKAARKKVFEIEEKLAKKYGAKPVKDEGQTYMLVDFGRFPLLDADPNSRMPVGSQ